MCHTAGKATVPTRPAGCGERRKTLNKVQTAPVPDGALVFREIAAGGCGNVDSATHYEIFHQKRLIAGHQEAARYAAMMEPGHCGGCCWLAAETPPAAPPRFDPSFGGSGEVMVRDLKLYEALSRSEGGGPR